MIKLTLLILEKKYSIPSELSSIYLYPTTPLEIVKIIKSLNVTNSVGYDEISTKVLKLSAENLAPVISYLINLSFVTGTFPDKLKVTIIKPLYKQKGVKELPENYRPIALIPTVSKVFEKAIHIRISKYFA